MRASNLDRDEVFRICYEIFAKLDGRLPAYPAVAERYRELHGMKGSSKVMQTYVREWRAHLEQQVSMPVRPDLPEAFAKEGGDLLVSLYQLALKEAHGAYDGLRAEAEERISAASAELEAERERVGALLAEQAELQQRLARLEHENGRLVELASELRGVISKAENDAEVLRARITTLEAEIIRADERLKTTIAQHAQALQAERTRFEERESELQSRHREDLQRERAVFEGERLHLQAETDRVRQAFAAESKQLTAQLEAQTHRADECRSQLSLAREELAHARGEVDALNREVQHEREAMVNLRSETTALHAEVARLRQELAERAKADAPPAARPRKARAAGGKPSQGAQREK